MLYSCPKDGPKPCPMEYYIQPFALFKHVDYVAAGPVDKLDECLLVGGCVEVDKEKQGYYQHQPSFHTSHHAGPGGHLSRP
jgi:hypothetical protein